MDKYTKLLPISHLVVFLSSVWNKLIGIWSVTELTPLVLDQKELHPLSGKQHYHHGAFLGFSEFMSMAQYIYIWLPESKPSDGLNTWCHAHASSVKEYQSSWTMLGIYQRKVRCDAPCTVGGPGDLIQGIETKSH